MIRELTLENFRAFRALHLAGLGRVNLLVGANNSGKTSVLEAVAFLASGGDPAELFDSLMRRSEQAIDDDDLARGPREDVVDVRHLFFGRKIGDDVTSRIGAVGADGASIDLRLSTPRVPDDELPEWRLAVRPPPRGRPERNEQFPIEFRAADRTPRYLEVASTRGPEIRVALRLNGGLTSGNTQAAAIDSGRPVVFIPTSGLVENWLARLYDKIVVTPEEATVVAALRYVEPGIGRLATRDMGGFRNRGFVVGMEDGAEQVPLGSLGDGVHRILAVALSLVAARGGYLLIDEIDTGLHHTVMRQMWSLVSEMARRLDVTVFATTHSYDCVHALAAIARSDVRAPGEVSLVRIERGNPEGIHFSEEEISHLAEWQIEAR
jgi:hypothetical protein